jgi:hypothetical protein
MRLFIILERKDLLTHYQSKNGTGITMWDFNKHVVSHAMIHQAEKIVFIDDDKKKYILKDRYKIDIYI